MKEVKIDSGRLRAAAREGMDAFIELIRQATLEAIGGSLTESNIASLGADQTTLLAYTRLREEVMDGGFVQLIHNGYGPFIFLNPFAKAIAQWGLKDLRNIVYDGRRLFEQYPEFDDLDDRFVEGEETFTEQVARYVDEHIDQFLTPTDNG